VWLARADLVQFPASILWHDGAVGCLPSRHDFQGDFRIFDTVSSYHSYGYIIPKTHLQQLRMTVNVLGKKVVGYPIQIKPERNVLYFNTCFVCDAWARTLSSFKTSSSSWHNSCALRSSRRSTCPRTGVSTRRTFRPTWQKCFRM